MTHCSTDAGIKKTLAEESCCFARVLVDLLFSSTAFGPLFQRFSKSHGLKEIPSQTRNGKFVFYGNDGLSCFGMYVCMRVFVFACICTSACPI